jgi:hypothetical protein
MENKNRYVVVIDMYVYADSNDEAIQEAKRIANEIDMKYDNKADVMEVIKHNFGSPDTEKLDI